MKIKYEENILNNANKMLFMTPKSQIAKKLTKFWQQKKSRDANEKLSSEFVKRAVGLEVVASAKKVISIEIFKG